MSTEVRMPQLTQTMTEATITRWLKSEGETVISDLPLDEKGLTELATKLKTRLGTGGTVKDGRIEIQGDHRDRIVQELEGMGYRAKRVGG